MSAPGPEDTTRQEPAARPIEALTDLIYRGGPGSDSGRNAVDLYRPAGGANLPWVVFCHGGAWLSGGRAEVAHVGRWLARQGLACACVGYRLAPNWRFPTQAEDVAAAVVWLRERANELGLDPDRAILAGHSAGAHLATLLSLDPRWLGPAPFVRGVAGLCGVYDLVAASRNHWMRTTMLVPALGDDPALWESASPVRAVRSVPRRFWFHNARIDWGLQRHTVALAAALEAVGVSVRTSVADGRHHLDLVQHLGQPDDASSAQFLAFCRCVLGQP